ncbi:MAG: ferredoxin, partial [Eubacteriales bacterium]|nr:ferredoxin [Eubacteriales bacterium]
PIAIDQACVDVIYTHKDEEGDTAADLIEQIDDMQGVHTIEHAAEIGLGEGTRNYRLVCID